jgi:hypothetical protein
MQVILESLIVFIGVSTGFFEGRHFFNSEEDATDRTDGTITELDCSAVHPRT